MVDKHSVELVVRDRAGPLRVDELIQFLIHFRAAYAVAAGHQSDERDDLGRAVATGEILASLLRTMPPAFLQMSLLGAAGATHSEELSFLDIQRENPTKFVLVGSMCAITAAVALAGGTIQVGPSGLTASTPGLVQSVINIREAFATKNGTSNNSVETPALPAPPVKIDGNGSTGAKAAPAPSRRMSVNSSKKK